MPFLRKLLKKGGFMSKYDQCSDCGEYFSTLYEGRCWGCNDKEKKRIDQEEHEDRVREARRRREEEEEKQKREDPEGWERHKYWTTPGRFWPSLDGSKPEDNE